MFIVNRELTIEEDIFREMALETRITGI